MCSTFPRIASCDYWRWGSGGRQENINAICVLALNMINDKVFLILWWWFLFLSIIGALRLVYRIIQTRFSAVRFTLIRPFFMDFLTTLSVRYAHGHLCDEEEAEEEGALLSQMNTYLRPSAKMTKCKLAIAEDTGDNLLEMITQPKWQPDEPDG